MWKTLLTISAALLLVGCAAGRERIRDDLRKRAAFDLQCPEEQIQLTELGDFFTQGATGCGKRATYVRGNVSWVLNSPTDEQLKQ
jgi:outer membrane biogenesis lipoprotein LolB